MNATPGGRPIIFLVARREVLKRLSGRVFRIGTVAMIALIAIGILIATVVNSKNGPQAVRVGFVGATTTLEPAFTGWATASGVKVSVGEVADVATGTAHVTDGTLDVLMTGSPTAPVAVVQDSVPSEIEPALDVAVLEARLTASGLTPAAVAEAVAGTHVGVRSLAPAKPTDPELGPKLAVAVFVAFLLYLSLALYGSFVAQGVVEEKATRIVEILLGTVRPSQLLAGKIIGIGLAGLLQLSIVGAAALAMFHATNVVSIPALSLTAILEYLVWFVLGFLFYATAYAAVAALVSRQEDVSGAIAPIYIALIAAYVLVSVVVPDPGSTVSAIISILPPFAPILMSVRMATGDATSWQVGLAIALELVSIGGLIWLAGRIYANSILRLGARVGFRDAFRGK
ncbi:MAG TPA: ABC transporter permease [Candidatus Limnocylindrales bacterium]